MFIYPKIRLLYKNYTLNTVKEFRIGKKLLKELNKLNNWEKHHIRFEFKNFKKPPTTIKHTMNEPIRKIKIICECMIKEIEQQTK